jgi:hypothetical protein
MKHSWINAEFAVPKNQLPTLCVLENGVNAVCIYIHGATPYWHNTWNPETKAKVKYWQPIIPPED